MPHGPKNVRADRHGHIFHETPMFLRLMAALTVGIAISAAVDLWDRLVPPAPAEVVHAEITTYENNDTQVEDAAATLQRRQEARRRFAEFTKGLTDDLCAGRLPLAEATERIYYYCLTHYTIHLQNVSLHEDGRCLREQLARNLMEELHQLCSDHPNDCALSETVARLDAELERLFPGSLHGISVPAVD